MKFKSLLLASALLLGVSAFAQETNKDAAGNRIYGPYETNKFWDNWFITLGPGLNMTLDKNFQSISSKRLTDVEWGAGIGVDASVGKWITPCSGVRVGWTGLKNGTPGVKFDKFPGNFNFNYIHGDFLWNISNQFAGYKEKRTINVVPYVSTGFIMTTFTDANDTDFSYDYALGAGFMFPIRCSNVVSIVPDMRLIGILDGERDGATTNALGGRRLSGFFNANISVLVNLGKNNWTRKSTSMAGAAAALAAAEASRNALQVLKDKSDADLLAANDKLAVLAAENEDLKRLLAEEKDKSLFDLSATPFAAYFDINKATLTNKELAHLDYNIKNVLSKDKALKIIVTGRADKGTGSAATNKRLSEARVKYVYDLMINKYGLDPSRFEIGTKIIEGKDPLSRAVYVGQ